MLPAFLPAGYEAPKNSNYYMKLQDGENKVRILSQPVLGWEDWDDKKPIRYRYENKPAASIDPKKPVRHFWAMIVFNYAEEMIQILQITQASIRNAIEGLSRDTDWGVPYTYDLKITKSGNGKDTEYVVNPLPHKPVHEYIVKQFQDKPCNLDALFDNLDPFSSEWKNCTPLAIDSSQEAVIEPKEAPITEVQVQEFTKLLRECDESYQKQIIDTLRKPPFNLTDLKDASPSVFARLMTSVTKKRDEYLALKAV